jgi:hypothetical protein
MSTIRFGVALQGNICATFCATNTGVAGTRRTLILKTELAVLK